jgi:hypothetical protein
MPLIHKRRIWWEPVPGATGYIVYVGADNKVIDPSAFSWGNTPGMISRTISGKVTEIVIPDEWPEFPAKKGTYYLAITAQDDEGNQSDPLVLSGVFNFIAPAAPSKGGIEDFPPTHVPVETPEFSLIGQGSAIIQRGLEEMKNCEEIGRAYLGSE